MLPNNHSSFGSSAIRPVSALEAVTHDKLGSATPIWNLNEVDYYVWINLNPAYTKHARLYEVSEVITDSSNENVLAIEAFEMTSLCWVKVVSQMLNMTCGKHVYKLSFVDTMTNDTFFLFVSYIIQNDNPNKPYVYMKPASDDEFPEDVWVDRR